MSSEILRAAGRGEEGGREEGGCRKALGKLPLFGETSVHRSKSVCTVTVCAVCALWFLLFLNLQCPELLSSKDIGMLSLIQHFNNTNSLNSLPVQSKDYTVHTLLFSFLNGPNLSKTKGRFNKKKLTVFWILSKSPPPLHLIWTTCTTFFECPKRLFKRHSKWLIIQNSS